MCSAQRAKSLCREYLFFKLILVSLNAKICLLLLVSAVRQSVFFALSMLLLAVPAHFLLTDLQNEITETREWLQGTNSIHVIIKIIHILIALISHLTRFFLIIAFVHSFKKNSLILSTLSDASSLTFTYSDACSLTSTYNDACSLTST